MIYKGTLLAIKNPNKIIIYLGEHNKKEVYPLARKAIKNITNFLTKKSKFYYIGQIKIVFDGACCPFVDIHLPILEVQPAIKHI